MLVVPVRSDSLGFGRGSSDFSCPKKNGDLLTTSGIVSEVTLQIAFKWTVDGMRTNSARVPKIYIFEIRKI